MDKLYQAALRCIPGIGNARVSALIKYFGNGQTTWTAKADDLQYSRIFDAQACNKFLKGREMIDIHAVAAQWEKAGVSIVTKSDSDYPEQLKSIYDAPQVLFYRGVLPSHCNGIAIVGARRASAYGKNIAAMLARDLAGAGCWVVSGAARGIDTAAHEGALETGCTLAVVGNGINVNYPPENARLLKRIAGNGAVLSEYPPDTPPHPGYFPARNRIINGLARGVVIVEAAERSGALITADYALEEGRDVFAVPGSIFSSTSKGAHRLIKQGAKLVEQAVDILEEYHIAPAVPPPEHVLCTDEQAIIKFLSCDRAISLEEIAIKTNLSVSQLTYILLQLELRGYVAQKEGRQYILVAGRKPE